MAAIWKGFSPSFLRRDRSVSSVSSPPVSPVGTTNSADLDSASSPPPPRELDSLALSNAELVSTLEALQIAHRSDYSERLRLILTVQQIITSEPGSRHAFRQHSGYLTVISVLASLEESRVEEDGHDTMELQADLRYELVARLFSVLAMSFQGVQENRSAFMKEVGYEAVEAAIKLSGLLKSPVVVGEQLRRGSSASGTNPSPVSSDAFEEAVERLDSPTLDIPPSPAERLFSILYSFLVNDFVSTPLYTSLRIRLAAPSTESATPDSPSSPSSPSTLSPVLSTAPDSLHSRIAAQLVERRNETRAVAENAGIVPLILSLLDELPTEEPTLRAMVLESISSLATSSRRSQLALAETPLLAILLARLFPHGSEETTRLAGDERECVRRLCGRLLEVGAGTKETRALFQNVVRDWQGDEAVLDDEILDMILEAAQSRLPPFIHFDLSLHGHSSLSLPSLGRIFPPIQSGYSFLGWISVESPPKEDEKLIIVGVSDSAGRGFVQLSMSPTMQLSFATSTSRPALPFNNFTFELGKFYHIAIVHQRSKISSTSTISLYVDGRLVETAKAHYPSSAIKDSDVRAWIGTPEDRADVAGLGNAKDVARWNLGPSWLSEGELSEEVVFVVANLGPQYAANFQDGLAQFQTNRTSTLLNQRLDGSKKKPAALVAILDKGSAVLRETQLYFALSALNVLESGSATTGLSQTDAKALADATKSKGIVVVNSALPRLDDALASPQGLFSLDGDPAIARPQGFDVGIASLGGVAVALCLIELVYTEGQLEKTVKLFVAVVSDSWRNSDDTERIQGYEVLAHHLRRHASLITPSTHDALFHFIGYDLEDPAQSTVSPLACRFLLLDLGLWSLTDPSIQVAHFTRLRKLIDAANVNKEFNLRRLLKMHLTRKLLFCLRVKSYGPELLGEVVDTLMLVLESHWTTESIRHVATFLTATLCTAADAISDESVLSCDSFVLDARSIDSTQITPSLGVLERLHDLLLAPSKSVELAKFAKVVTTKWILLFLLDKTVHPLAAVFVLRILAKLLQAGSLYETKFSADSFSALREALPQHLWNYSQVHLAFFALLHDRDISTLPLDAPFSVATSEIGDTPTAGNRFGLEVYRIVIACLGRGIQQANEPTTDPNEDSAATTRIPLVDGFKIVLELLVDANRSATSSTPLAISPVSIQHLVNSIRPFLPPLPTPAASETVLPLPLLSSRDNYQPPVDTTEKSEEQDEGKELSTLAEVVLDPTPPPNEGSQLLATLLLNFLGDRVGEAIVGKATKPFRVEPNAAPIDPGMRVLHDVLEAIRSESDLVKQVAFRTLILKHVTGYITTKIPTSPSWKRIASYVEFATGASFQGWNADVASILDLALSSVERLIDGNGGNATSSLAAASLGSLFRSLNRLILLSLIDLREENLNYILPILTRHQLSIFAGQNCDVDFFRCFIQRLDVIVRTTENVPAIELFKLLSLERHLDVEAALGVSYFHDSEARLIDKLINSDISAFTALLVENRTALSSLDSVWESFVDAEVVNARLSVADDIAVIDKKTGETARQKELQSRRTRKQQASIFEWSEGIHDVEATRVAHTKQDITEHASFIATQWTEQLDRLTREGGLWGSASANAHWRLDFTEGHSRMRIKLQLDQETTAKPSSTDHESPGLRVDRQDSMSVWPKKTSTGVESATPFISQEETIWNETFPPSEPTDTPPNVPAEVESIDVVEEDKNRKVRRSLEPGDVIVAVFNVYRIVGLDACAGLLLFAEKNLYLVDGFFQKASGEVVDAADAPEEERDQHLQTLADLANRHSKSTISTIDPTHHSRTWSYAELIEVHQRSYLFRNVALELFFSDGRSFLITFADTEQRAQAYQLLGTKCPPAVEFGSLYVIDGSFGSKVTGLVRGQRTKLEQMTKRWQRREVSNFDYLMFLNTCAGRTYNDLTNYPVFPWVLADYTSETLDLTKSSTFRDLSKPMGAQSEPRRSEFRDRYTQLMELDDDTTKPFHYGTHYSSAMIAVGFLVRLRPFTASYLALQGGNFDHADRQFWSVASAWESCSRQSRSDVRELIPEFFFLPDFLENHDGLELGIRQENGAKIDTVTLPPWAHENPRLFVELHRKALESDYVSENLQKWIDLIFGFRQTGSEAVDAVNVFHHLSYDGAIDLDAIEDENEREAATSTIHNFGMTPRQLFSKPHRARIVPLLSKSTISLFSPDSLVEQQSVALVQCIAPVASIGRQVGVLYPSETPDKTTASPSQSLFLPGDFKHFVSWGFTDRSLRLFSAASPSSPIDVYEGIGLVTTCCFADSQIFITGSLDTTVNLWKLSWKTRGKNATLERLACLTGHSDRVRCITASRSFSIIVSGSDDRSAIIWDLNRYRFVRRLADHESSVDLVAISDKTGDIVTCSGSVLRVWTVNGTFLAIQATSKSDPITAVAFSLSEISPIIATGHRGGKIITWRRVFSATEATSWKLEQIAVLQSKNRLSPSSSFFPDITSLRFTARTLYAGDSTGDVWLWNFCSELYLDNFDKGFCMNCTSAFGLIESRRRCSACAGVFCSTCSTTSIEIGGSDP